MTLLEAIQARHSVRSYTTRDIGGETLDELRRAIDACNRESGLNMQLCANEPDAFAGLLARYGKFKNVRYYIALVGKKSGYYYETCGYYGQKIVLRAQQLGLNTCWVASSYSKGKSKPAIALAPGETLLMVITLGYGETAGTSRRTKPLEALCRVNGVMPEWFRRGMEAAQLAPTAINQQKFRFELCGDAVKAAAGSGPYAKVDLGIAKCHFEIGAGEGDWKWAE